MIRIVKSIRSCMDINEMLKQKQKGEQVPQVMLKNDIPNMY